MIAVDSINEDDFLFSIPRPAQIVPLESSLATELREARVEPWSALILVLLHEFGLGEASRWWAGADLRAPYLGTLPAEFTTPLFWSDSELEELAGTQCLDCLGKEEIAEKFESVIKPFIAAHEGKFPEHCRSYEMFLRMGSLILSRAFDDEAGQPCMVPVADLLNSRTGATGAKLFRVDHTSNFEMHAARALAAGEQVFNTYGDLSNSELLRKYGYVDEPNPYNSVALSVEQVMEVCAGGLGEIDEAFAEECETLLPEEFLLTLADARALAVPDELLALVALFMLAEVGDVLDWLRADDRAPLGPQLGPETVAQAHKVLLIIATARIADYGETSHEDDLAFLKDMKENPSLSALFQRKSLATKCRVSEREILVALAEALRGQLQKR